VFLRSSHGRPTDKWRPFRLHTVHELFARIAVKLRCYWICAFGPHDGSDGHRSGSTSLGTAMRGKRAVFRLSSCLALFWLCPFFSIWIMHRRGPYVRSVHESQPGAELCLLCAVILSWRTVLGIVTTVSHISASYFYLSLL
jgi:hypothetical protein